MFLFILISFQEICCQGCWKQEREALLRLNAHLGKPLTWLDDIDCCQWERVKCNTTTGRVVELDLSSMMGIGYCYFNYYDFLEFEHLKSLYLSFNHIAGCVENKDNPELRLSNLQVLDLSYNSLNNMANIVPCLDRLSSLKSLYLSSNRLNATSFHAFQTLSSKLLHLKVLDLSLNHLTNEILPSLSGFKSLSKLYLSKTGLDSELHVQGLSSMLINLEVLDMEGNNFSETDIASSLSGLSSLKSLNLRHSQLTTRSIHSISKLSSLKNLDLSGNHLNNSIIWFLGNERFTWPINLQDLRLSENNFGNDFLSCLNGIQYLQTLDLSLNKLGGSLDINGLLPLSNLEILDLSYNKINNFVVHQGSKSLSRLEVLNLDKNKIDGNALRKSLQPFSSIRVLYMSDNEFKGRVVAEDFCDLGNLEELALDYSSNLENKFFKSIGVLNSLKVLSLSSCGIDNTLPAADLSYNEFEGSLPSSFGNMTSLRTLKLSYNHFTGNFGSNLASLTSLEYFGFVKNNFQVPISFTPFANLSNLKFVYGNGNKVIDDSQPYLQNWVPKFQLQVLSLPSVTDTNYVPLPKFLLYQYNLTSLDCTGCKLKAVGEFPKWLLENNTKIKDFVLRNCSIKGTFQLPSHPLLSMWRIDLSDNAITGQISSNNISSIFPNLQFMNMSINAIHGSLPDEFGKMNSLDTLDLSDNHLSGEIPKNISRVRSLRFLKLSNNKLDGSLFPTLSNFDHLEQLYLDGNSLSGGIPSNFSSTTLLALDISNNNFVGKLPSRAGNLSKLEALCMSNNHLEGSIPTNFVESKSLVYLDISQNNLSGVVPSFANSSIRFIHLSNNRLSGLTKRMFSESSSLVVLDLRNNEINTTLHDMIQDLSYTGLYILLLKGNYLRGQIPKQLCQLIDLTILDLSYNSLSGPIPSCLGKLPFKNDNTKRLQLIFGGYHDRGLYPFHWVQEKTIFTTKKNSYPYTGSILDDMTGIDLSYNKLTGNIPPELGSLTSILALNISHNQLTGKIPDTFSNLLQIESLDLSFNMLSGNIPTQLSQLTFLEVFSVVHNNLSGAVPDKGQFMNFDESSYEGNPFLCGPTLPKICNADGQLPAILPNGSYIDGDFGSLVDMYVFSVTFAVSYTSTILDNLLMFSSVRNM
ncbi:Leucine-rich repeat [Sesbania bispinosa]|nr:Leucine-rich repeat [Sesbania bispinosa]